MTRLANPEALLLLLLLPAMAWLLLRRARTAPLQYAALERAQRARPATLRVRLRRLPDALKIGAAGLLIVALARPQAGLSETRRVTEGVALQVVIDRSGSMEEIMPYEGRAATRLAVVKDVVSDFVAGGAGLPGRPNDLIGIIAFARFAETVCPLVRDPEAVVELTSTLEIPPGPLGRSTAIGDGLALAAARLKNAEENLARWQSAGAQGEFTIASKAIVLLTDGESNAGETTPLEAAKLAAEWGIRVYTIGIGAAPPRGPDDAFMALLRRGRGVDERTLSAIAEETGGRFFLAGDAETLREVYAAIDALEKTRIESIEYTDYEERFAPFALAGLALLGLALGLSSTMLRSVP